MDSDDSDAWRWVDAEGVESSIDEWELVSSLSSGTLPPYTLVWKTGWKTWHPACRVDELSTALPDGMAEPPETPEQDPTQKKPPPPPLERYAAYRARSAARLLSGGKRVGSIAPPPPPPPRFPVGSPPTPPPPPVHRPPMPTFVEPQALSSTATLRPPGAVPPPPRGVPERLSDPGEPEMPTAPRAAATPLPIPGAPQAPIILEAPPPPARPAAKPGRVALPLIAGGLAAVFLLVIVVSAVMLYRQRQKGGATAGGSATASASNELPTSSAPCTSGVSAKKLAAPIYFAIPPYLAEAPGEKTAVGFAAGPREGVGLVVDPTTLAANERFRESSGANLTGVVPLVTGGKLSFQLDSSDDALAFARTINADPSFSVGVKGADFSIARGGNVTPIWPGGGAKRITEPRVASIPDVGHVVTFREGGQSGAIRVGWMDEQGKALTELGTVKVDGSHVGTPMVTANDRDVLVVFAAKATEDSYWRVQLASAPHGENPVQSASFRIPPGGPGAEAISPAAAGLSGGRWLIQWTEGSAGTRQVRAQTLAHDLIPIGDPMTLSPEGANAGQGVVWLQGNTALALFLTKSGKSHELWGAALKCP